jgi:predicted SAM-dependent methyltransferase
LVRKLHIGGKEKTEGWEVLNVTPDAYVDHVCNANDLSIFEDNTFSEVYASHILEHLDYNNELVNALKEWNRVLCPGGKIYISVPDLDVLSSLIVKRSFIFFWKKKLSVNERFHVMRMMFGGHIDEADYHMAGLNEDFLCQYLMAANFTDIRKVGYFNLFSDTSSLRFKGKKISLNLTAKKEI